MNEPLPPGVRVIERGWLSANLVLIDGRHRAVVDTGYVSHEAQTVALVEAAFGAKGPDLLLNTHLHSDHCGGNAALQARFPRLPTLVPPGLADAVRTWDTQALTYAPTGQRCPRFDLSGLLQPGEQIDLGDRPWQIHAAPGHDTHSVILFEPQSRTLISADALWENGFGVVFPEIEGEDAFCAVGATLDLIESLRPATVIPGHGAVFAYRPDVMDRSRRRLDAFVRDPLRHARHAAKVLLKFKLLEVQRQPLADFLHWAGQTEYLCILQQRWHPDQSLAGWIGTLLSELQEAEAATLQEGWVLNR
jgi:glyoxylase-like metal-dependent hydrolase (beta-lactamase superfamily II)